MHLLSHSSEVSQVQLAPIKEGFQENAMWFTQYATALVVRKMLTEDSSCLVPQKLLPYDHKLPLHKVL